MTKTTIAILCLALLAPAALAQYREGKDYELLPAAMLTADPKKIEVLEAFAYSCIHCFRFEASIKAWKKRQQDDVNFVMLPVAWGGVADLHARAFYTNQALKIHDQLHDAFFEEIHIRRRRLGDKEQILGLVEDADQDAEKYAKAMDSFGVTAQLQQAQAKTRSYGISATPSVIVNGKYRVVPAAGRDILAIIDFLVQKEREAKAAAR